MTRQELPKEHYDLVLMIHWFNTISDGRENIIRNIYNSLKENGYFFIVDIGRPLNVDAWVKRLFYAKDQLEKYDNKQLSEIRRYFDQYIFPFNRNIEAQQKAGALPLHDLKAFESFIRGNGESGYIFSILQSGDDLYNPFCDGRQKGLDDWIFAKKGLVR